MDIKILEEICSATCFRIINDKLIYPSKKENMCFMLIYPTDGYYLTKEQYQSIFGVIGKYSDHCYCVSDIEFEDSFTDREKINDLGFMHKIFTDFVYDDYTAENRLFENALYDLDKKWGISIFQDEFAVISGEEKIIKDIRSCYSNVTDLMRLNALMESSEVTNKKFKSILTTLLVNSL